MSAKNVDNTRSLDELKALIEDDPNLTCPTDDEFLLRFLRAKNFKVSSAFRTLKNYVAMRQGFPDNYFPSAVKKALKSGMVSVLKGRDVYGCHIFYFRTKLWDIKDADAEAVFIACTLVLEEMLNSVDTQDNGVVFLHDLSGLKFSHCFCLGYQELKRVYKVKGAFPARFKKAHAVNPTKPCTILHSMVYAFVSPKLWERLELYKSGLSDLYNFIPKSVLPKSLGGELEDEEAIDHELMDRLLQRDEYFRKSSELICKDSNNL